VSAAAEIVFDRVSKRYPGRDDHALLELSLAIPAGTFCVLVGPSGGGKTTALKMVNRLVTFDEGDIRIDGRSVRELPAVELRREIGYVIQQIGLFPHETVGENIATVPRLLGWPKARIAARVEELLGMIGLDAEEMSGRYPGQLSGGQRQRVAIARALAAEPRILILDESVAALDVSIQAQVLNLLADIRDETGVSYVLISHDLAVVRQLTDEVLVLHRGRMVERGPTSQVLDDPQDAYTRRLRACVPRPGWKPVHAAPARPQQEAGSQ
jgi:ABC-type proline/glycine betaine transport system ATPase subunit